MGRTSGSAMSEHLSVAIPPVDVDLISAWMKTTSAREKICRFLQNATGLLATQSGPETAESLLALKASSSATRKVLRFWNPIDNFRDMFKQLFVNKGDFLARLFSAGGAFGCGMTFVMDHFSYIHKIGMRKRNPDTPNFDWWSDFFWLVDAVSGLLAVVYKMALQRLAQARLMTAADATASANQMFVKADKNQDGQLSKSELKKFLGSDPSVLAKAGLSKDMGWSNLLGSIDQDGDGKFDKSEFAQWWVNSLKVHGAVAKLPHEQSDKERLADVNNWVDLVRNLFDIPCALACIKWSGYDAPVLKARIASYGVLTSVCGLWQSYNKINPRKL